MSDVVYFMRPVGEPVVKIGTTSNVLERKKAIQSMCGCPVDVVCVLPGSRSLEDRIHYQFKAAEIGHEWFHATKELISFASSASLDKVFIGPLPRAIGRRARHGRQSLPSCVDWTRASRKRARFRAIEKAKILGASAFSSNESAPPHERLKEVMDAVNVTHLSDMLSCSRQMLYYLASQRRTPGRDLSVRIEDALGIPMRAWTDGHA